MGKLVDKIAGYDELFESVDIQGNWEAIKDDYYDYLQDEGVVLPAEGTAQAYWLIYLYQYLNEDVGKDELSLWTYANLDCGLDQQVRHLISRGWYVLGMKDTLVGEERGPGYRLVSTTEKHPDFKGRARREARLSDEEFDEIKECYDYRCATCEYFGRDTFDGNPIPGYSFRTCILQQGHMDPTRPLSQDNCIPQCQICNQSAKDRFYFDENGCPYDMETNEPVDDYWNR